MEEIRYNSRFIVSLLCVEKRWEKTHRRNRRRWEREGGREGLKARDEGENYSKNTISRKIQDGYCGLSKATKKNHYSVAYVVGLAIVYPHHGLTILANWNINTRHLTFLY